MSSAISPDSSTKQPFLVELRQSAEDYLPNLSSFFRSVVDSSSLMTLAHASLRATPRIAICINLWNSSLVHKVGAGAYFLSANAVYLEAAMMSCASTIHSIAFALIYTGLSFVTLGIFSHFTSSSKVHWQHAAFGLLATGTSLCGVVCAPIAMYLSLTVIRKCYEEMKDSYNQDIFLFETQLIGRAKQLFDDYSEDLQKIAQGNLQEAEDQEKVRTSIDYLDWRVSRLQRVGDLIDLVYEARRDWPILGQENTDEIQVETDQEEVNV